MQTLEKQNAQNKAKIVMIVRAPEITGEYTYTFRLRESPTGPIFGDEYVIRMNVSGMQSSMQESFYNMMA